MTKSISYFLSKIGRKGATNRWKNWTPEQRSNHMRKMAIARHAKRKAQARKPKGSSESAQ